MGYLNNQFEKKALTAVEMLTVPAVGSLGAAIGTLNSEKENRLASALGGATGGVVGGVAGLPAALAVSDALEKSKRLARLLREHPKLGKLLTIGANTAPLIGLIGGGSYAGSELAKKLKNTPSE
jgi:hypothetical protein